LFAGGVIIVAYMIILKHVVVFASVLKMAVLPGFLHAVRFRSQGESGIPGREVESPIKRVFWI